MTGSPAVDHDLGKRLQAARRSAGLTQVEAMHEVRQHGRPTLSESSLQRWEYTGSIRLADAIILARIYGCSLDELAGVPIARRPRKRFRYLTRRSR